MQTAAEDLRALWRCLRQAKKRQRDSGLLLELVRRYFALEMGQEARQEWEQTIDLDSSSASAHSSLAIKHLFRGVVAKARRAYSRTCALDPILSGFAELQRDFDASEQA